MIIAFFQVKGGSGKSTLSSNIVIAATSKGGDVIYVNADPQSSTGTYWSDERSDNPNLAKVTTVEKFGKSLGDDILDLRERYDNVVVDLGAKDENAYREVLLVADVTVIPLPPSASDVWTTIEKTFQVTKECKTVNSELSVITVINNAPANPHDTDVKDLQASLAELDDISLAKHIIKNRKAYRRALKNGMGVLELTGKFKDNKANEEIQALYQEIYNHGG